MADWNEVLKWAVGAVGVVIVLVAGTIISDRMWFKVIQEWADRQGMKVLSWQDGSFFEGPLAGHFRNRDGSGPRAFHVEVEDKRGHRRMCWLVVANEFLDRHVTQVKWK